MEGRKKQRKEIKNKGRKEGTKESNKGIKEGWKNVRQKRIKEGKIEWKKEGRMNGRNEAHFHFTIVGYVLIYLFSFSLTGTTH